MWLELWNAQVAQITDSLIQHQRADSYDLEKNERDQPLTLSEDLAVLRSSGLKNVSAFWLEYRELVSGGQK